MQPTATLYNVTTIVRDHLSKTEMYRLDGPVPLARGALIELPDGHLACVMNVRLVIGGSADRQALFVVEVSPRCP